MARILIDMDGVLADFVGEAEKLGLTLDEAELTEGFFLNLPVIKDAVWGVLELDSMGHDLYVCTTAPWDNPSAWMEKRIWIEKVFGDVFNRKLIMTHQKSMIAADILIDDRKSEQTKSFKGTWYWFRKDGADWKAVVNSIEHNFK